MGSHYILVRNSSRILSVDVKTPPSAVVCVIELVSLIPRYLTQSAYPPYVAGKFEVAAAYQRIL